MRIAVAASGLGHIARGVEAWAADLGRALADRGHDVTLYKGGGQANARYERLVRCWQQGEPRTRRLFDWLPSRGLWRVGLGSPHQLEQTTFALGLIRRLRRTRADVLHVQDPLVARLVQRARRAGVIRTAAILAHGTEESLDFLSRITFLQHLAPWHLEQARGHGVWKPTWTAIPNFIDTNRFAPGPDAGVRAELGIRPDEQVVLTVAAIKRHHKRIDYLLTEFAKLLAGWEGRRPVLVVAGGRTGETDELVTLGRQLLGDRVRFLVNHPRERMPDVYRAADLFALTSSFEMMPIAVLEATASGLPCLVNRHPVLEWMAGPGRMALELEAPGALAAGLREALTDTALRRDLGTRARAHCQATFSVNRVVSQILAYYQFVVARARRPAGVAA